jgi:hypothetical protein
MAATLGPCLQEVHAVVREGRLPRPRTWPPPIRPASAMVWWEAQHGRVVTSAVRSPVRPATRWMRVVSMASARVIAGKIVVSRTASIDFPAPGGPRRRTLWAERLHQLQLYHGLWRCRWSAMNLLSTQEYW